VLGNYLGVKVTSALKDISSRKKLLLTSSGDWLNLLPAPVRRPSDSERQPPADTDNSDTTSTKQLERAWQLKEHVDVDETTTMTSPSLSASPTMSSSSSSSAAAVDVTDCRDDAAVTQTDDAHTPLYDDVIRQQSITDVYHVCH